MLPLTRSENEVNTSRLIFDDRKEIVLNHIVEYLKFQGYKGEYKLDDDGQIVRIYNNPHYSIIGAFLFGVGSIASMALLLAFGLLLDEFVSMPPILYEVLCLPITLTIAKWIVAGSTLYGFIFNKIYPEDTDYYDVYLKDKNSKTLVRVNGEPDSIEEDILDFLV